jgi:hypothetical protein
MFALAAGAAAAFGIVPASAAQFSVTYTGTVSTGFDNVGKFGTANTDLTGVDFSLVYLFDTSLGQFTNSAGHQDLYGGSGFLTPTTPLLSAALTINGNTVSFAPGVLDMVQTDFGPSGAFNRYYAETNDNSTNWVFANIQNTLVTFPSAVDANFVYSLLTPGGDGTSNGQFRINGFTDAWGNLSPTTLEISAVNAEVPLPGALPLFAGGLGAIALLSRRKKHKAQALV